MFPFEEHGSFFLRKTLISTRSKICTLASGDRLSLWHKCQEHNNNEDSLRLKYKARGLKISADEVENCEKCQMNKSRKLPFPKLAGKRSNFMQI